MKLINTRNGGRKPIEGWLDHAIAIRAELDKAKRGDRDDIHLAWSEKLGTTDSVIRRMVSALRFIRTVETEAKDEALARRLEKAPMTCLTVLDRWSQYALDNAVAAARRLANGEVNLPMLKDMEESDAKAAAAKDPKKERRWQRTAATQAIEHIKRLRPGAQCVWFDRSWKPVEEQMTSLKIPGRLGSMPELSFVNLIFARDGERPLVTTVLSGGPQRGRAVSDLARLVVSLIGIAQLGYECALLINDATQVKQAQAILAQTGRTEDVLIDVLEG